MSGNPFQGLYASSVVGQCSAVGSMGSSLGSIPPSWGQAQRNGAAMQMQQMAMDQAMNQLQAQAYSGYSDDPPPTKSAPPVSQSKPTKELSVFSEVARDVKTFILEHRSTLYFLAIALILDHLLFKDAFRHRLQSIVDKIVTKVEDKVSA